MSRQYRLVALLPMKAHSARVTGKNFRLFAGVHCSGGFLIRSNP